MEIFKVVHEGSKGIPAGEYDAHERSDDYVLFCHSGWMSVPKDTCLKIINSEGD